MPLNNKIILSKNTVKLRPEYCVEKYIEELGSGKYGDTWKINFKEDESDEETKTAAIKILKPFSPDQVDTDPLKDFREEITILKKLRHPGVVRIIRNGECETNYSHTEWQPTLYHISELEENVKTIKDFLGVGTNPTQPPKYGIGFITSVMQKVLEPLQYCHKEKVLHLDLHWGNILISPQTINNVTVCDKAVLIDFGKAKHMDPDRLHENDSMGGRSFTFNHPHLLPFIKNNKLNGIEIFSESKAERFDLYSVAICFEKIYEKVDATEKNTAAGKLISNVIKALKNEGSEVTYEIERALVTINRIDSDLSGKKCSIRLLSQVNVSLDAKFMGIIDTPEFQRLRNVAQLGLTSLVYPSATHTRFSHSLGVYDLCGQYINHLSSTPEYIFAYSAEDETFLKLAALTHDVGHYPFAHYLEELRMEERDDRILFKHSEYTKKILSGELIQENGRIFKKINKYFGTDAIKKIDEIWKAKDCLTDIVDGSIDCDKVDYLLRDGVSCGVPYSSSIDKKRLLGSLTCQKKSESEKLQLCITPKGIAPVETVVNARYQLFSQVYWQKVCRAIASMLKHAMYILIDTHLITQDAFDTAVLTYGDNRFLTWMYQTLYDNNKETIADDLVGKSFLQGRREIYKTVITISAAWGGKRRGSTYKTIANANKTLDTYDRVISIQSAIVKGINTLGYEEIGKTTWQGILSHELLLDIPPADKDIFDFPDVYYTNSVRGQNFHDFENVSSIVGDEMLLKKVQKIRIFLIPNKVAQLKEIDKYDSKLRKIIRDACA